MMRLLISALASAALIAAPVSAQTATVKNSGPLISGAIGKPAPKTWADWWVQLRTLVGMVKPVVGDVAEPELGADFTKVPAAIPAANRLSLIGAGWPASPRNNGDVVGAFRFICQPGHVSYDDLIIFPGQPGKSHLHQWFGNTAANASSTYASLRTSGDSTCMNTLNRSAYWMPAMLDGKGNVVRPDYIVIYYKRRPVTDPWCAVQGKACVDLPRGLRYVFGYDMQFGTPKTGSGYFNCDGPTAKPGHYATITEAAKNCPAGNRLGAVIAAPDCWDGKRLDSPNHRDHMAYTEIDGRDGIAKCPATHPNIVPAFTMGAWYTVADDGAGGWYLSSDEMEHDGKPMRMPAGSTFHADWFGAWDDETLATAMANCINRLLSCNSGDLGNGTGLNQVWPHSWNASPRLVPVPAREVKL